MRISFSKRRPMWNRRELEAALDTSKIPVRIVEGHPYDTMGACDAALATSGTVVLEAALMDLPASSVTRQVPSAWPLLKPSSK